MPFDSTKFAPLAAPVVETEVQRLIALAKERIRTPNLWVRGSFFMDDAACLRGAFMHAMEMEGHEGMGAECRCAAYPYVVAAIEERMGRQGELQKLSKPTTVQYFNDGVARDHADVLAVLDRAYELAAEK